MIWVLWFVYGVYIWLLIWNFFFSINGSNACKQTITSLNIYVEQYQHTCPTMRLYLSCQRKNVHVYICNPCPFSQITIDIDKPCTLWLFKSYIGVDVSDQSGNLSNQNLSSLSLFFILFYFFSLPSTRSICWRTNWSLMRLSTIKKSLTWM